MGRTPASAPAESQVANSPARQEEAAQLAVLTASEAESSDFADEDVFHGRLQGVGLCFHAVENERVFFENQVVGDLEFRTGVVADDPRGGYRAYPSSFLTHFSAPS